MSGYRGLFANLALLIVASAAVHAQAVREAYDPSRTFARLTLPQPVNRYRSADGAPGPDYWQNRADYEIHARLDTLAHQAIAGAPGGDPVAALVFGPPAPLELLLVGGAPVVERGELRTADMTAAAREVRAAQRELGTAR